MKRKLLEEGQRDALRFEHVIADILSRFARADPEQLDDQIRLALEELLAFAQVDRFGVFRVDPDSGWVRSDPCRERRRRARNSACPMTCLPWRPGSTNV